MKYFYIGVAILIMLLGYWWMLPARVFCGGFAGIECPTFGYTCTREGNYPDAGTNCTKIFTK